MYCHRSSFRGDTSFSKIRVPDDPSFAPDFARLAIGLKMAHLDGDSSREPVVKRVALLLASKTHPSARDHRRRVVTRSRAHVNGLEIKAKTKTPRFTTSSLERSYNGHITVI